LVGEQYDNALAEFDLISDHLQALEHVTNSKIVQSRRRPPSGQSQCALELLGGKRVLTVSAQKGYQALTRRGEAPDLILLTEMEALGYDIWLAARGRVAEKRGRVVISGKFPDDVGWQAELYRRWQGDNLDGGEAFCLPTWSNLIVFPSGRDDSEIRALEATVPAPEFARDYGGEPQKPATLVFPEFSYELHVRDFVEYDPHLPVEVWLDPGYGESAYAVLAVQIVGSWVFVIDEVYEHGLIGEEIIELCKEREWWGKVPKASRLQTGGVIDVAGRQHHAAKSQIEVWLGEADVSLRSQSVSLEAGRSRLKSFLMEQPETNMPRLLFSPRCKHTHAEFGKYRWARSPEERVAGQKPVDRDCDAIKALCYGLVDKFGVVQYPKVVVQTVPRELLWRKIFRQGGRRR